MDIGGLENDAERLDPTVFVGRAGALAETDTEVAIEIGKGLVGAGQFAVTFGGAVEFEAVSFGEVDANADVELVGAVAVIEFGLLSAVAAGAAAGDFDDLGVRSVNLDFGYVGALVGGREGADVLREEREGGLVIVLAEEVRIADGFRGEGSVEGEERLADQESGR